MSAKKSTRPRDKRDTRDNRPVEIPAFDYGDGNAGALEGLPDLAGQWADCYAKTAAHFRLHGALLQAKEHTAHAAHWRGLAGLPEAERGALAAQSWRTANEEADGLLTLARTSPDAARMAGDLVRQLLKGLHGLAADGNAAAARELFGELCGAVTRFETLAKAKPEIFEQMARNSFGVPALVSQKKEKGKENEALAKQLHAGEDFPLKIGGKRDGWKYRTPANLLAASLQHHIQGALDGHGLREASRAAGLQVPPAKVTADAAKLGAFNKDTADAWADVAIALLEKGANPAASVLSGRKSRTEIDFRDGAEWGSRVTRACPSIGWEARERQLREAFATLATGETPRNKRRRDKGHEVQ